MGAAVIANRFEVQKTIATGGMGRVFHAIDRTTGLPVALKHLIVEGSDAEQRFSREAEALKLISHPNIVKYVDHGRDGTTFYLAMDYVPGEPLSVRLTRDGLTIDEAVGLGVEISGALGALHAQGLVHRDVKPANIMVPRGATSPAMLVDFGLVRKTKNLAVLTSIGVTVGSPGYMSPEQLSGEPTLTPAVDVYALGCVLYLAVTGVLAFPGNLPMAVHARILALSPAAPHHRNTECPLELSELIMRMLSTAPSRRPVDGAQAHALLSAINPTGSPHRIKTHVRESKSPLIPGFSPTAEVAVVDTHFAIALAPPQTDEIEVAAPPIVPVEERALLDVAARSHGASQVVLGDGSAVLVSRTSSGPVDRMSTGALCSLELARSMPKRAVALCLKRGEPDTLIDRALELLIDEQIRREVQPEAFSDGAVRIDEPTVAALKDRFETVTRSDRFYLVAQRQ